MLFCVAGFLAYYLMQRQEQLAVDGIHDKAESFSEMLSLSAAAGLEYDDKQYVLDIFGTMQNDRDLKFVRVLRKDSSVFAGFVPGDEASPKPPIVVTPTAGVTPEKTELAPAVAVPITTTARKKEAAPAKEDLVGAPAEDDDWKEEDTAGAPTEDDDWKEENTVGAPTEDDDWGEEEIAGVSGNTTADAPHLATEPSQSTEAFNAGLTVPQFDLSKGQDSQTVGSTIYVGQEIRNKDGEVIGQAQMAFSLTRVNEAVAAGVRVITVIVISTLFACAFAFVLALKFEKAKTKAFQEVKNMAERVAAGNKEMRLVMDNVDQGFITLNREGAMAEERSAVVDKWFGSFEAGASLWDYLTRMDESFAIALEMHWESMLDPFMPIWCHVEQLPNRLTVADSTFEFSFSALEEDEQLKGMLVVITDITKQLKHLQFETEQKETVSVLEAIMTDRSGFLSFHNESTEVIQSLCEGNYSTDPEGLSRAVHTLKGNSSLYDLKTVSHICHTVEEQIKENENLTDEFNSLRSRWEALTETLKLFGVAESNDEGILIDRPEYEFLIAGLQGRNDTLLQTVQGWELEKANVSLSRLAKKAQELARRLAKGELNVVIESDEIRFDNEHWNPLWSELSHVIRNAVDHGMDSTEERIALGKSLKNTLRISARIKGDAGLVISVADDGAGINWDMVAAKAKDQGHPHKTRDDLIAVLFEQGFTTRDQASALSGRGVGMAAVWNVVKDLGGTTSVESELGEGTAWNFSFAQPSYMLCDVPKLSSRKTNTILAISTKESAEANRTQT